MTEFPLLVRRLERAAARWPAAEALVHGRRRVSYAQLWDAVLRVAGFLREQGVGGGERVAVVLENSAEYVAAYYGALAAGAVAVALNPAARARELNCWLEHCGARCVFLDGAHPDLHDLAAGSRIVVTAGRPLQDSIPWSRVVSTAPAVPEDTPSAAAAAILYTSGTTGRPKGVTLSHRNMAANAAGIIDYLGLDERARVLNLLPFYYSYGSSVLHTHLAVGGTIVLENSFVYPRRVLEQVANERVTGLPGVPSTFSLLLSAVAAGGVDLASLRYVTQAGGAMTPSNILRLRELLPHVRLFVMYGQTEATARLSYLPPDRLGDKLGSVGIPVPGVRIEVRDEQGRVAPAGVVGEVFVQGPNVMIGYYADPEATGTVLRDGWLRTGDLGYLDADGFLYLHGRRADIIKTGAHRVSPLDIEEVIAALPEVAEVAVVGVPDDLLGEAIKAVVALHPGALLDAMTVQRHCRDRLPRYKVPKVVDFASRLPRTSSGKIMRYQLAG